ncbi:MAG: hypothetical protein KC621_22870, partial [Myxococcales bacterium]|nr:hypothetical protein [Myxococcales bacterium]
MRRDNKGFGSLPRTVGGLVLGLALAVPTAAHAQSWSGFSGAFPAFPCQDGWMACIVGGQAVDPGMQSDADGHPLPADMRVGWFDLQPTATFSPFGELSAYTGADTRIASAEPPPEPTDA